MRNQSKKSELESKFPLLAIEGDCIVSKDADVTVAFALELPELFTVTSPEYETMHATWNKAVKVLPRYSILHKQDWFIKENYRADFEKERFLLDWLRKLAVFDEADYDRWRNHLLDELVIELKQICRRCSDRENAVAAMESILAADFYRTFLAAGYRGGGGGLRRAPNRVVIGLLQGRRFDALRFFCTKIYRAR